MVRRSVSIRASRAIRSFGILGRSLPTANWAISSGVCFPSTKARSIAMHRSAIICGGFNCDHHSHDDLCAVYALQMPSRI
jgi:hypothetical protein